MASNWLKLQARVFLTLKGTVQRLTLGAQAMVLHDDKVLLIRQGYYPAWQFPGGGVDPGESMEAAARRETLEETGVEITGPCELFGVYHNTMATNRDHIALYVARQSREARLFKPSHEIREIRWFDVNALPDDIAKSTARRIDEVLRGAPVSEIW